MRISTALVARDHAIRQTRYLYSAAKLYCPTAAQMDSDFAAILATMRKSKAPQWAIAYVKGYRHCLRDSLYESALVFGAWIDGKFYSTYRSRDDYYEKQGINASDYAAMTQSNASVGHYWAHNVSKPYFTSN